MKGNFRTIKGNPLPPVQPSLGNSPRKKLQPQTLLLAFKRERVSFITNKRFEVIWQGLDLDGN